MYQFNGHVQVNKFLCNSGTRSRKQTFQGHYFGSQAHSNNNINSVNKGKSLLNGLFSEELSRVELIILKNIDKVRVLSLSAGPLIRTGGPSPTRGTQTGSHSFLFDNSQGDGCHGTHPVGRKDFSFLLWNIIQPLNKYALVIMPL